MIDELVRVCKPRRYFHIGMDEDHYRSQPQYVDAILRLRKMVKRHRLRTVIDSTFATPFNQNPIEYGIDLMPMW